MDATSDDSLVAAGAEAEKDKAVEDKDVEYEAIEIED